MNRNDYFNDPQAPKANSIVPAVSAIVLNEQRDILLHKRSDNHFWALPGGAIEPGEGIKDALKREVFEETGLHVEVGDLIGVYSNPGHVIAFRDGEVRQEFSLCFACQRLEGELQRSGESLELRFVPLAETETLAITPSIRQRIADYQAFTSKPAIR